MEILKLVILNIICSLSGHKYRLCYSEPHSGELKKGMSMISRDNQHLHECSRCGKLDHRNFVHITEYK